MVTELDKKPGKRLVHFLDIGNLNENILSCVASNLDSFFEVRSGFSEQDRLRPGEFWLATNSDLICHLIQYKRHSKVSPVVFRKAQKGLERRLKKADPEELYEMYETVASRVKAGGLPGKEIYYQAMVNAYAHMRRECIEQNNAGHILATKVQPIVPNDHPLGARELKSFLTQEEYLKLRRGGFYRREITLNDIEQHHDIVIGKDKQRVAFHDELKHFAASELGKNALDVVLDIFTRERFRGGELNLWKGDLHFAAGIKLLEHGPSLGEFTAYTPEKATRYEESVRKACVFLQKAQTEEGWQHGRVTYKSDIDKNHSENDDITLLQPLFIQFPGFLRWEDRCAKYMHGAYLFIKSLVIDVEKIKAEKSDPEGFIDDLTATIKDLVGEEKVVLCSAD